MAYYRCSMNNSSGGGLMSCPEGKMLKYFNFTDFQSSGTIGNSTATFFNAKDIKGKTLTLTKDIALGENISLVRIYGTNDDPHTSRLFQDSMGTNENTLTQRISTSVSDNDTLVIVTGTINHGSTFTLSYTFT